MAEFEINQGTWSILGTRTVKGSEIDAPEFFYILPFFVALFVSQLTEIY